MVQVLLRNDYAKLGGHFPKTITVQWCVIPGERWITLETLNCQFSEENWITLLSPGTIFKHNLWNQSKDAQETCRVRLRVDETWGGGDKCRISHVKCLGASKLPPPVINTFQEQQKNGHRQMMVRIECEGSDGHSIWFSLDGKQPTPEALGKNRHATPAPGVSGNAQLYKGPFPWKQLGKHVVTVLHTPYSSCAIGV